MIDALAPFGVQHADMPLTPAQVWLAIQGRPLRTDLAFHVTLRIRGRGPRPVRPRMPWKLGGWA